MAPATYARLAGVLFAAQAAFAVVHRLRGGRYAGFTLGHDVVMDGVLALIWGTAAVAALFLLAKAGVAMIAGLGASIMHGLVFSMVSADAGPRGIGLPFLAAAVIEGVWIARAAPALLAAAEHRPRWPPRARRR